MCLFEWRHGRLRLEMCRDTTRLKKGISSYQKLPRYSLAGNSSAATLRRNICCENRIRTNNEKILLIIDAVNEAINNKKKISFQYFKYNVRKEKQLRHEGQYYTLSPLDLVWNGDHYYIVGVGNASEEIICFRVDRIAGCPRILNEDSAIPPEGFNIDQFINTTFRMFNGDHEQVELICDNDVILISAPMPLQNRLSCLRMQ